MNLLLAGQEGRKRSKQSRSAGRLEDDLEHELVLGVHGAHLGVKYVEEIGGKERDLLGDEVTPLEVLPRKALALSLFAVSKTRQLAGRSSMVSIAPRTPKLNSYMSRTVSYPEVQLTENHETPKQSS